MSGSCLSPRPPLNHFSRVQHFPLQIRIYMVRPLTLEENPQGWSAVVQPDPIGPVRSEIDRSEINLSWSAPQARGRDACMQSTPWRLRSALAPLLLDGSLRRG
jgi:hypothetical protein